MAIPFRGVHKSIEIFLDRNRLKDQAFVTDRLGVFDQNSCGAIDAPHPKSRPQKSAVGVKFFQPRHGMETIDRNPILAIKAVIGPITDSSSVEQLFPFHAKVKRRFPDLIGSPHADGIFELHGEFKCLSQTEIFPDGDRTFVPFRINAAAEPSKTHRCGLVSKSGGSQLIVNASKSRFLNLPRLNPDLRLGCLPSASTRITEMNECENSGLFVLF